MLLSIPGNVITSLIPGCSALALKQAGARFEPDRKLDVRYCRMTDLVLAESIAVPGSGEK